MKGKIFKLFTVLMFVSSQAFAGFGGGGGGASSWNDLTDVPAGFADDTDNTSAASDEASLESGLSDVTDVYTNNDTIPEANIHGDLTRDSEWDTAAEINSATTDTDMVLDTDIGGTVQAYDADLDDLADGTLSESKIDGSITRDTEWDTMAEINAASTDTDAVLDTDIGATVQAFDADLTDLADGSLTGSKVGSGIVGDNISFDNSTSIGDGTSGDVTVTIDGDAGTDGKIVYDVSSDAFVIDAPSAAPADGDLSNGSVSFWVDATGNEVEIKAKDSSGDVVNVTVGSAAGSSGYHTNYLHNLQMNYGTATTVTIEAGEARSDDDDLDIDVGSQLTCTITTSGANGLEASDSETSSTWYEVYVISKSDGTDACLMNEEGTAITTTPTDYNDKRLVGHIYNDSGSDLFQVKTVGNFNYRQFLYTEGHDTLDLRPLSGGTSTSWTSVDVSVYIPDYGTMGYFGHNSNTNYAAIGEYDEQPTNYIFATGNAFFTNVWVPINSNKINYKKNSSGNTTILIHGWSADY